MSSVTFRFPNEEIMRAKLSENEGLNMDYFQEKGITQAITDLAVQRFADSEKYEGGITFGVRLMMHDLQQGVDGFSGAPLPKLQFDRIMGAMLTMSTEQAVRSCAEAVE